VPFLAQWDTWGSLFFFLGPIFVLILFFVLLPRVERRRERPLTAKTKLIILLFSGVIIRLLCAPFGTDAIDFGKYAFPASEVVVTSGNLYLDSIWNHFPLFIYVCALMNLLTQGVLSIIPFPGAIDHYYIFGFFFKLPIILADTVIAYLIYHFARNRFQASVKRSQAITMLYFLNPLVILEMMHSRFDALPVVFTLLSIKLLLSAKDAVQNRQDQLYYLSLAGLALGVAVLMKVNAILAIPIMLIAALEERKMKNMVCFGSCCASLILGGLLPFMLVDLSAFFSSVFSHPAISFYFDGLSFWNVLSIWLPKLGIMIFSDPLLNIFAITCTLLACFFIIGLYFFKRKTGTTYTLFLSAGAIILGFLAFYKLSHTQFYLWYLPFISLTIFTSPSHFPEDSPYIKLMGIEIATFVLLFLANFGHQISFMPGLFSDVATGSPLGAVTAWLYSLCCLLLGYFASLKILQKGDPLKISEKVFKGGLWVTITWVTLVIFVEWTNIPYWGAFGIAYSLGLASYLIWTYLRWRVNINKEKHWPLSELIKQFVVHALSLGSYWLIASLITYFSSLNYFVANMLGSILPILIITTTYLWISCKQQLIKETLKVSETMP